MKKHYLFTENGPILVLESFDKEKIKAAIIDHLTENPGDLVEHCKDFSKVDLRKYYGHELLNVYAINPANKKPSKVVQRGNKEAYLSIVG